MFNISVIVPTYNGEKKILNIIQALEQQSEKEFEVIIAVDGSTDSTISVVEQYSSNLNIKIVKQENKGRAAIRNFGAFHAKGETLVFFDDDMRPLPDCIEKHVKHHIKHQNSVLVGRQVEELELCTKDSSKFKAHLSRKWEQDLKDGILKFPYITAANFSIDKSVFNKLNGFNENLTDAEDFELACRAFKMNIPIYYNSSCLAWHDDFISLEKYSNRQVQYLKANKKVFGLHPEFKPKKEAQNGRFKLLLFKILSNDFLLQLADYNVFFLLPKKIRYKLFDIMVSGKTQGIENE